mmetsp:Transcript_7825/g.21097  ORF Transcript_7825/g.21097 Transcript_7825/m.21097 type:complete len:251 (-) Transcript_7825:27-779(-)
MATGRLRQALEDADAALEARRGDGDGAKELRRMEAAVEELRKHVASLPMAERGGPAQELVDFERRLARRQAAFKVSRAEASREALFAARAEKPAAARRRGPGSQEEAEHAEAKSLSQARDSMRGELERMQQLGQNLDSTSKTISASQDQYQTYDRKLADAAKVLGQLKRKTEEDSKYIWWSFLFFLSVCAYIVLKRLKVFRMIYYGASWTAWSGSTAAGAAQGVLSQAMAAYQQACEHFGIPSAFDVQVE